MAAKQLCAGQALGHGDNFNEGKTPFATADDAPDEVKAALRAFEPVRGSMALALAGAEDAAFMSMIGGEDTDG